MEDDIIVTPEAADASPSELDILGDDPVDTEPKETPKEEPKDEPLEDLEDEKEEPLPDEEDEEEDEEDDETYRKAEVSSKISLKEINQKYPKLFKEYPAIREALAKENTYSRILPTIEDAKEAVAKAQTFDFLSESLETGNCEPLVKNLHNNEKLVSFAENILPEILKTDKETYLKATLPVIKKVLRTAFLEGHQTGNKNVKLAAQHLTAYLFGTHDPQVLNDGPKEEVKADPEKEALKKELDRHILQAEQKFIGRIRSGVEKTIKTDVIKLMTSLDPGKKLTQFHKDVIVERVIKNIDRKLTTDEGHIKLMRSLREKAMRANFAGDWEPRVITAYLGGAKNLQISYTRQLVAKALGNDVSKSTKTIPQGASAEKGNSTTPLNPKDVWKNPKKRMTPEEFIAAD